jgi:L-ascorbate metabolism protein UlaG (beta-lactamase superfamily)
MRIAPMPAGRGLLPLADVADRERSDGGPELLIGRKERRHEDAGDRHPARRRAGHAGDTALFSDMERIGRPVQGRGLDVAVLPIGDLFTMGPDDAVEAVRLLKPKLALPSHYGTWPPIEQDAIAWARRVESAGLAAAKAPAVGEPITIG